MDQIPDNDTGSGLGAPLGSVAGKSSTGMDENVAAGVSLLLGWITGLIFFLIEKDSRFVKFYAFQAILLSGIAIASGIIFMIPVLGWIVGGLGYLAVFIFWVMCLINAFGGKIFKIPVVGNIAAQQAGI